LLIALEDCFETLTLVLEIHEERRHAHVIESSSTNPGAKLAGMERTGG
jgi:hypothetical protein